MNPADDFILPDFDRPMDTGPSNMTYEQVLAEFDEIIQALRLREVTRPPEDIPEFKM